MSCIATWGYRCIWWQWVVHVHVQFSVIRYVQCFLVIFFFTAHSIWLNQKFRGNVSEAKPSAIVWLRSVVCIGTVPTTPLASCNLRREKWMMIALTNQRIVIWIYIKTNDDFVSCDLCNVSSADESHIIKTVLVCIMHLPSPSRKKTRLSIKHASFIRCKMLETGLRKFKNCKKKSITN